MYPVNYTFPPTTHLNIFYIPTDLVSSWHWRVYHPDICPVHRAKSVPKYTDKKYYIYKTNYVILIHWKEITININFKDSSML